YPCGILSRDGPPTLTSMVFGSGGGFFPTLTASTPSWSAAVMASRSASSGNGNLRTNLPIRRSMRWYLASLLLARRRRPLMTRVLSSSTWTFILPDLAPGMSISNTSAPGTSLTSAGVEAMALRSRTLARAGALATFSTSSEKSIRMG
ncbi:unnamed protein product, partial [Musa hybrid cultivar]